MRRTFSTKVALSLLLTAVLSACASGRKDAGRGAASGLKVSGESFQDLQRDLLMAEADPDVFASDGPFAYDMRENLEITLGKRESLLADLFLPRKSGDKVPLVIFVHGNYSKKEVHRYQAQRVASFGMVAMAIEVPNRKRWMRNGDLLARFTQLVHDSPEVVSETIDPERLVLVGHSFGGSAISIATGKGAPIKGIILLDPAIVSGKVKSYLKKVSVPVILLGADEEIFRSRRRKQFFASVPSQMVEVSIKGATHDDAQYPSLTSLYAFGFDPFTNEERQKDFMAAITLSAFSLVATGDLDYAWQGLSKGLSEGMVKSARKK